jgi:hypothetical protein
LRELFAFYSKNNFKHKTLTQYSKLLNIYMAMEAPNFLVRNVAMEAPNFSQQFNHLALCGIFNFEGQLVKLQSVFDNIFLLEFGI